MPQNISSPTDAHMQRYLRGELTGAELESVERYLEAHAVFRFDLPATIGDDPLLQALKDQSTDSLEPDTPKVRQLIERMERLPGGSFVKSASPSEFGIRNFGDYQLQAELGSGGMGVVFRALQVSLHRPVALKMILAGQLASPEAVERFRVEAEAAAHLDHPNIVPVYEVGMCDGHHYFSMKLIAGRSLSEVKSDWCVQRTDEPSTSVSNAELRTRQRKVARLVELLAGALDHAHQRGVLHRDLKPGNVLIDEAGEPHITDFGLAKRLDHDSQLTVSHAIVGTPAYMSPEQAIGAKHLTTAADVYGLGTILYELLTGRRLFQGDSPAQILRLVMETEPTAPRAIVPRLSLDLETICLKCLQKEPQQRYVSAAALATDLRHFLKGEPIQARPVGTFGRFGRWCRRNPVISLLTAGAFLSLSIGLSVATFFAFKAADQAVSERRQRGIAERRTNEAVTAAVLEKDARGLAERKEKEAIAAQSALAKKSDELQRQIYRNTVSLAYREWQAQNGSQAALLLNSCDPKWRGWEWSYCSRLTRLQQLDLHKDPNEAFDGVAFSPDGSRIAGAGELGTVVVWDAVTGQEYFSVKYPRPENQRFQSRRVDAIKYTPDGTKLVVAGLNYRVRLLDANDGQELATYGDFDSGVNSVAISADGRRIAASRGNEGVVTSYEIRVWDFASRQQQLNLNGHTHSVNGIAFSPDGRRLVSGSNDRRVKVWDLESGREVMNFSIDTGEVVGVTYSRDGERILAAGGDSLVHLWNATTGEALPPLSGHRNGIRSIACSPDGQRYATASLDGTAAIWNAKTGERLWTLQGHDWNLNSLAFSHDGRRLATAGADRRINVWDATADPQHRVLKGHLNAIGALSLSHDGQYAATLAPQSSLVHANEYAVWDLASGELVRIDQQFVETREGHLPYRSLDFGPEFQLASGGSQITERSIQVWDALSGRTLSKFAVPEGTTINSTSLSPDGQTLAVASDDAVVRLFDAKSGQEKLSFRGHEKPVGVVRFSPDGRMLASGSEDRMLLWDLTGRVRHTLPAKYWPWKTSLRPICFSRDSKRFATVGFLDGNQTPNFSVLTVIDLDTGLTLAELRGHSRTIFSADFSKDGTRIATGSDDNLIKIWDVSAASELLSLRGHTAPVNALQFTPDGTKLISAGADGVAIVWDASPTDKPSRLSKRELLNDRPASSAPSARETARVLVGHRGEVRTVSLHPTGKAVASGGHDGTVRVWNLANSEAERRKPSGEESQDSTKPDGLRRSASMKNVKSVPLGVSRRSFAGDIDPVPPVASAIPLKVSAVVIPHESIVTAVLYSPDGRWLSWATGDSCPGSKSGSVWISPADRLDEKRELLRDLPSVECLAFTSDGRQLAMGGFDGTVRLCDSESGELKATWTGQSNSVLSAAYSPDDKILAVGTGRISDRTQPGEIRFWNVETGQLLRTLNVRQSASCLSFLPGGMQMALSDWNRSAGVIDATTGVLAKELRGHDGRFRSHVLLDQGRRIATVGEDSQVLLLDLSLPLKTDVLAGHTAPLWQISATADSRVIATASSDGTVRVWSVPAMSP